MKKPTEAAQHLAWVFAALLLVPATGGAWEVTDEGSACQAEQAAPQRAGQPPAGPHRGDRPGDKGQKGNGQDHPARPKWWLDPKLRAELGITDQQSVAIDKVWQKSRPQLGEGWQKLEKLEDTLSQMIDVADEAAVIAQIERVENARAEFNKGRTLMIYRMDKLLTPDQRAKVKAMHARPEPPRRGPSGR